MKVEKFLEIIDSEFYVGVPDSQLKALCDYLFNKYGVDEQHHLIAANEGNCTALAAGYYMATGKIPVVYMQNSGEGNIINPVASLLNKKVYGIPVIFIIGWRGEPGVYDEPQHIYQGEVTLKLLDDMGVDYFIVGKDTTPDEMECQMRNFQKSLSDGRAVAFVIRKNALQFDISVKYKNKNILSREDAIKHIVKAAGSDPIISTTGKASRELFEIRENRGEGHQRDFLTVGSMGHASSIAVGIAMQKKNTKIWCIDGDGAMLMHMGALAFIGAYAPGNFIHIVINNGAHETVGGMPTVIEKIDVCKVAKACGYENAVSVKNTDELDKVLEVVKKMNCLNMIEVRCSIESRKDLGRPTTTPEENIRVFMDYLKDRE